MRNNKIILLLIAVIMCFGNKVLAKTLYSGQAVMLGSRESVEKVEIYTGEGKSVALTDYNGRFSFYSETVLSKIIFKKDGFIESSYNFYYMDQQADDLEIFMLPINPDQELEQKINDQLKKNEPDYSNSNQLGRDNLVETKITTLPETVRVLMPNNTVVTMALDEYVKGVVPREVSASWPMNSLKSQAMAARCYAAISHKHTSAGADVCTLTHCQAWSAQHYATTDQAVNETHNYSIKYNGQIIESLFFAHCNGHTRNNEDYWQNSSPVDYLRSVSCVCGFTSFYGHGVGMCQEGTKAYANNGWIWENILKHYYTGTVIDKPNTPPPPPPLTPYSRLWARADVNNSTPSWFSTTANTERGIAYANDQLYVCSRNGSISLKKVNYLTGADLGELSVSGISGGTFALNDVESSWEGKIFGCNLVTSDLGGVFKIYRWNNDNAVPEVIISYDNSATKYRLGDNFTFTGESDGNAVIYAACSGTNKALKWTISNGVLNTVPVTITLAGITSVGTVPSIAPFGNGVSEDFYINGNSISPSCFSASGTAKGSISTTAIPTASNSIKMLVSGGDRYLAVFQSDNSATNTDCQNFKIVKITDGASSVTTADLKGVSEKLGQNSNSNMTGDLAYRFGGSENPLIVYVLSSNNGIAAYKVDGITASSISSGNVVADTKMGIYPNPFNPTTTINYQLTMDNVAKLSVYNAKGELVKILVNEIQSAGSHSVSFDGSSLNSGVYFVKLVAGKSVQNQKLILIK